MDGFIYLTKLFYNQSWKLNLITANVHASCIGFITINWSKRHIFALWEKTPPDLRRAWKLHKNRSELKSFTAAGDCDITDPFQSCWVEIYLYLMQMLERIMNKEQKTRNFYDRIFIHIHMLGQNAICAEFMSLYTCTEAWLNTHLTNNFIHNFTPSCIGWSSKVGGIKMYCTSP